MGVDDHPRVSQRHPEVAPDDVEVAFDGALRSRARDTDPVLRRVLTLHTFRARARAT